MRHRNSHSCLTKSTVWTTGQRARRQPPAPARRARPVDRRAGPGLRSGARDARAARGRARQPHPGDAVRAGRHAPGRTGRRHRATARRGRRGRARQRRPARDRRGRPRPAGGAPLGTRIGRALRAVAAAAAGARCRRRTPSASSSTCSSMRAARASGPRARRSSSAPATTRATRAASRTSTRRSSLA